MDRFENMCVFIRVVEAGGISAAADRNEHDAQTAFLSVIDVNKCSG